MSYKLIKVSELRDHPLNRDFPRDGEKWQALVKSMELHGMMTPMTVRPLGKGIYQVLAGHRRKTAAEALEMKEVECIIRNLTDSEALDLLVIENLEREDLDAVEEARLVKALLEDKGGDVEAVRARLAKSLEWIETRQGLLDLGDEVMDAVRRPLWDERRLGLEAVRVLLAVAAADRERAVALVMHPEFKLGCLNAREAADVVKEQILEPARKKREWESASKKHVKAWRKALAASMNKVEHKELVVMAVSWEIVASGQRIVGSSRNADDLLYGGIGHTWAQLAVRHGLPVWVVPAGDDKSDAVVDESLLRLAEQARVEAGLDCWLPLSAPGLDVPKAGKKETESLKKTGVENADDVIAELDALDAPAPEEEGVETVIEQCMEHYGMIDLGEVRRLAAWAADPCLCPEDAPDWVPAWARQLRIQQEIYLVKAALEWVLNLRSGRRSE